MKLFRISWIVTLAFNCCSQLPAHHLPTSAYYKQQEAAVLAAVSGQVMTHRFFIAPIDKADTISIYDSLIFPRPLPKQEISRLLHEHRLITGFAELLRDTTNWSQAKHSVSNISVYQIQKAVSFTPKYLSPNNNLSYPAYVLSRVIFNHNFTKSYFQLTWLDLAGGVKQYVLCQKENGAWTVKTIDSHTSFKI